MTIQKKQRPIFLDLRNIKFPLTAIASISHRISGSIIFIVFGILLITLKLSLISAEYFYHIKSVMNNHIIKFFLWSILIFFIYHYINGIRHVLIEINVLRTTLKTGKISANIIFLLTGILSILVGFLLC